MDMFQSNAAMMDMSVLSIAKLVWTMWPENRNYRMTTATRVFLQARGYRVTRSSRYGTSSQEIRYHWSSISHILEDPHESSITLQLLLLLLLLLKSDFTIDTTQAAFCSITRAERANKKEPRKN